MPITQSLSLTGIILTAVVHRRYGLSEMRCRRNESRLSFFVWAGSEAAFSESSIPGLCQMQSLDGLGAKKSKAKAAAKPPAAKKKPEKKVITGISPTLCPHATVGS
jgi:hypothetical protein